MDIELIVDVMVTEVQRKGWTLHHGCHEFYEWGEIADKVRERLRPTGKALNVTIVASMGKIQGSLLVVNDDHVEVKTIPVKDLRSIESYLHAGFSEVLETSVEKILLRRVTAEDVLTNLLNVGWAQWPLPFAEISHTIHLEVERMIKAVMAQAGLLTVRFENLGAGVLFYLPERVEIQILPSGEVSRSAQLSSEGYSIIVRNNEYMAIRLKGEV